MCVCTFVICEDISSNSLHIRINNCGNTKHHIQFPSVSKGEESGSGPDSLMVSSVAVLSTHKKSGSREGLLQFQALLFHSNLPPPP